MAFDMGEGGTTQGEVTELEPPRRFAFTWGEEVLRFELEPDDGGGCRLRFTHLVSDERQAARDAAGWHVCLDALERLLAGEPAEQPPAGPTDEWEARYAEYAARGLPTGAPVPGRD
jgi:hypothetical protein